MHKKRSLQDVSESASHQLPFSQRFKTAQHIRKTNSVQHVQFKQTVNDQLCLQERWNARFVL